MLGSCPSASNDWVSVSTAGLIVVKIIFDDRSCIMVIVTKESGLSSED